MKEETGMDFLKETPNTNNKPKIMIVLDNGDSFVYGGDKSIEEIHHFMIWGTPATIMWKDENNNTHVFGSKSVKHIYTFNS